MGQCNNQFVDTGEWIEFTFNNGPVDYVSYEPTGFTNNHDQFIEAWGVGGAYLGSVFTNQSLPNWQIIFGGANTGAITQVFGGQAIRSFRITPTNGASTNVSTVEFGVAPSPNPKSTP